MDSIDRSGCGYSLSRDRALSSTWPFLASLSPKTKSPFATGGDRGFESCFLQRGVRNEPRSRNQPLPARGLEISGGRPVPAGISASEIQRSAARELQGAAEHVAVASSQRHDGRSP